MLLAEHRALNLEHSAALISRPAAIGRGVWTEGLAHNLNTVMRPIQPAGAEGQRRPQTHEMHVVPRVLSESSMFCVESQRSYDFENRKSGSSARGYASIQCACSLAVTCIGTESGRHKM